MPSSPTPGSPTSMSRNFDADIGLRRMTTGSALPSLPQSVPRGRSISWLHWFACATACQVARPPVRIRLERPAFEDFYFQASNGSVALPVAGYNYNSDWTPLLAGLSPAGMAASLAAPEPAEQAGQGAPNSVGSPQPSQGRAAHHPGWPALVLGARHPDGSDAPGGVPLRTAPNRRVDRLHHPPAWP